MKKMLLIVFTFIFIFIISIPSFAFDLYGWWNAEKGKQNLRLIKIDEKKFDDRDKYKIIDKTGDEIKISFEFTPTYHDEAKIKINGDDEITISYPSYDVITYKRVTHDITISKKEAMQRIEKAKTDQNAK